MRCQGPRPETAITNSACSMRFLISASIQLSAPGMHTIGFHRICQLCHERAGTPYPANNGQKPCCHLFAGGLASYSRASCWVLPCTSPPIGPWCQPWRRQPPPLMPGLTSRKHGGHITDTPDIRNRSINFTKRRSAKPFEKAQTRWECDAVLIDEGLAYAIIASKNGYLK
jgi:hypothetical protein